MRGLDLSLEPQSSTHTILSLRLAKTSGAPIALGLSGGGDSVALAIMAANWARTHKRVLHLLTVDHQLNPSSGSWSLACAALAARLGFAHHILEWTGFKPTTGLPAAARLARHNLLAIRARELGAKVILLGHTADDRAESRLMRQAGSSTPDPREWTPSPVWPQGRDLFLLRPMLNLRRQALRQWLADHGETWTEDPANQNPKFARSRARNILNPATSVDRPLPPDSTLAGLAAEVNHAPVLSLPRELLRMADLQTVRTLTGIACLCASGGSKPPRSVRLVSLVDRLLGDRDVVATLAGARIEADATEVRFMRNPGELRRRNIQPMTLHPGVSRVWDGRYEVTSTRPAEIAPLQGHMASLSTKARQLLRKHPAAARGALPLVLGEVPICPILEVAQGLTIGELVSARFRAATGLVTSEPL